MLAEDVVLLNVAELDQARRKYLNQHFLVLSASGAKSINIVYFRFHKKDVVRLPLRHGVEQVIGIGCCGMNVGAVKLGVG